ncbi:kelch motif-containing protein [Streptomyces sp. MNU89]|uniref:kelch motif-containing protein n=1 Tax=Streptomyces sp. MNU89 TaxID=2560025 RepID=UPI001E36EF49|nr:kelch motif-containing protein [Streptomyces sp. MNU89]MCC9742389.1 kelch motif-containing protein [Streptomyces sp. MNU89]
MRHLISPRFRTTALGAAAFLALAGLNAPAAISYAERTYHAYKIEQPEYKARYGHWDLLGVPEKYRVNAIHAALLHTGKVLLIAGSGNNEKMFRAGTFKTLLWDPEKNTFRLIPTPEDLFCSGHAQLPSGKLLVAGGTARYEVLEGKVERAGGGMLVKNEDPDRPHHFPRGTVFRSPDGKQYRTTRAFELPAAEKKKRKGGKVTVTASEERVFVEAVRKGRSQVTRRPAQYSVDGLKGADRRNVYGLAQSLTLDKQDYHGLDVAYEFDPVAERYLPVDPMAEARWYPTLTTLKDGRVLAVSGLDEIGQVVPGKNEVFDPETRTWSPAPERYFPTYPALFLTRGGDLFYSGSNAGYGPADKGRAPGLWNVEKNTFRPVPGLSDQDQLETSASVLLPPAQEQKVMVLGGGGVGESPKSTARTAVADLARKDPRFTPGPDLPQGTRYLSSVLLPDDTVFTTGGSEDYRGKGESDIHKAQFYLPEKNAFRPAASPVVGRNYHSEALLLPDGRVATFGSDPLYADPENNQPGTFEQRVEIFSPPYLHRGERPRITGGPAEAERGDTAVFTVESARRAARARLMRPSAVTHTTDVEQRSVELGLERRSGGRLALTVPEDPTLVPRGWYMLFVTDSAGVPSKAHWVHIR